MHYLTYTLHAFHFFAVFRHNKKKQFCYIRHNDGATRQNYIEMAKNINIYINKECVTVEHVIPAKNAMSSVEFDPGTSRIVSHHSTN